MTKIGQHFLFLLALVLFWLILNETTDLGYVLIGILGSIWVAWMVSQMRPVRIRIRRVSPISLLIWYVLIDMLYSNVKVAKQILFVPASSLRSGIVEIPLDIEDPHGLAVLACIITYTPGTVWADYTEDKILHLHVLDLENKETWILTIKERYESLLLKIFEEPQ